MIGVEVQIRFTLVSSVGWIFYDEFDAVLMCCCKEGAHACGDVVRTLEFPDLGW